MPNVSIDIKTIAEGQEVELLGLGVFKNGETVEVTPEVWEQAVNAGLVSSDQDDETIHIVVEEGSGEPTAAPPTYTELEGAAASSANALERQMELQKERQEDPLATANVGIDVSDDKDEEVS